MFSHFKDLDGKTFLLWHLSRLAVMVDSPKLIHPIKWCRIVIVI